MRIIIPFKIISMSLFEKHKYLILFIFIAIYLSLKSLFWPMQKNIQVTVLQQQGHITDLYTPGKIIDQKKFNFDKLSFPLGEELFHQNTGYLGYTEDFFIHAKTQIDVLQAGNYTFTINSDDGFLLKLNNNPICEHSNGRAMETSTCSVHLEKGKQLFDLTYFQGYGSLGLKVSYKLDSHPSYVIGMDSNFMTFNTLDNS